ncbi:MAG: hypothetical protein KKE05_01785 [Nanoarchaeota archaeon]|nr:hypothetical protein [Nanoarchaeota archaeon]
MKENQFSRYGAIAKALPPTLGKIFFVAHGSDTFAGDLQYEFPTDRDGVPRVYVTTAGADTDDLAVQAALDACTASQNDYVLIAPSNNDYDLATQLTMSKRDVHLIGMDYLFNKLDVGCNSATKIDMVGADHAILLTGGNCEIAGLYVKNYVNKFSVQITGNVCDYPHIHHNSFLHKGSSTSGVAAISAATAGSSFITVEKNQFSGCISNITYASVVDISASCTWATVRGNNFVYGDGNTLTKVINCLSYKGQVIDNDISAINGGGGATSTFTNCITIGGGCAMGNRMAVVNTTTTDLAGGGTYSFVENYNGLSGGTLATTS